MAQPIILESVPALRAWRESQRQQGKRVGLVPTMGALHQGHISLVARIHEVCEACVVSIFVNPAQFAPTEDFSKYPRTFDNDIKLLSEVRTQAVFAPSVAQIYPPGFATTVSLEGPAKVGLEDAFRPTHFAGVATVVAKLLLQCLPDVAIFGEKDFQQLAVVRAMTRDLDIPVEILGGMTLREPDGLALSSRNVYLSETERQKANLINRLMREAQTATRAGASYEEISASGATLLTAAGFAVDYFAIRDAASLQPPAPGAAPESLRILVAAKLGKTRLIDNMAV